MKQSLIRSTARLAIASAAVIASLSASASLVIDYNVGGWGPVNYRLNPTLPGDTLEMLSGGASGLNLPDNTVVSAPINTLLFTIGYSANPGEPGTATHSFTASRLMTITAPAGGGQTVSQSGAIGVTAASDSVTIGSGIPIVFTFAGIGTVSVTPNALYTGEQASLGTTRHAMTADFLFTPVPEPSTYLAGALLGLPLVAGGIRHLRRSRKLA